MAISALWTHGNAVIPETPQSLTKISRFGFGTEVTLQTGTQQWFHVPMPTPVFLNGVRPKLARIIILGKSDVSSCIGWVHIFDGNDRKQIHRTLICGDNLSLSQDCIVETGRLQILKGLGISMSIDSTTFSASYFFASFGADWE